MVKSGKLGTAGMHHPKNARGIMSCKVSAKDDGRKRFGIIGEKILRRWRNSTASLEAKKKTL